MRYIVNAWFEREDPQLTVTDPQTGQVLIDWDADLIRELMERGELDVGAFRHSGLTLQKALRELFLISCRQPSPV